VAAVNVVTQALVATTAALGTRLAERRLCCSFEQSDACTTPPRSIAGTSCDERDAADVMMALYHALG
jgi:hypothetical protein